MQIRCVQTQCGWWSVEWSRRVVVGKDQLLYWRSLYNWVVYLKILVRENLFNVNLENWEQNTRSNSPETLGTKGKIGKERVHRKVLPESVRLMSVVFARRNSRKNHMRRSRAEKDARAEQHDILRKTFTSSRIQTKLGFFLLKKKTNWSRCIVGTHFEKTGGARSRSRFRSINAHAELNSFLLRWIGYFLKVQNHHCGTDCHWESAHQRGSTSVRSQLKSVRDRATSRRNACSYITWKNLWRPRNISYLLSFQRFSPIWEVFVFYIATARLVKKRSGNSLLKQSLNRFNFILMELIHTFLWWSTRSFIRSLNCVLGNLLDSVDFKGGKSFSRLEHVPNQQTLISRCTESKRLR